MTKLSRIFLNLTVAALVVLPAAAQDVIRDSHCGDTNTTFGNRYATWHTEEVKTIVRGTFSKLDIRAAQNGGVKVVGWDSADVEVHACKFVEAYDEGEARQRVNRISINISGGSISADMPSDSGYSVHFLVRVPANITLTAESHNGPLGIDGVTGTIQLRTVNGPLSIRRSSGTITGTAQNGPIDLVEASGKVDVSAQNGPVTVRLADLQWKGEGLKASTENGPMELRVPSNYQSGVEVTSDGHSPFRCSACRAENRTWDDDGDRMVRLGRAGAPVVVRLSTHNGPVSVRNTMD